MRGGMKGGGKGAGWSTTCSCYQSRGAYRCYQSDRPLLLMSEVTKPGLRNSRSWGRLPDPGRSLPTSRHTHTHMGGRGGRGCKSEH